MDLTRSIDIYCERLGPEFWAEPVNALTNLSFIAAALWAWRFAERRGGADGWTLALIGLTGAVGVGSFLFHTFAVVWSAIADVLPIWLFVLAYAFVAIRRFFGLTAISVALGIVGTVAGLVVIVNVWPAGFYRPPSFNGSIQYAPVLAALAGLALALRVAGHRAWPAILGAAGTLFLSLTFRTIDPVVCAGLPLGTHFLWHLLNGLVFAFALYALIAHAPDGKDARR